MQKIVCITGGASGFGRVLPPHVNICTVEVMPVCQSCGPLAIYRES